MGKLHDCGYPVARLMHVLARRKEGQALVWVNWGRIVYLFTSLDSYLAFHESHQLDETYVPAVLDGWEELWEFAQRLTERGIIAVAIDYEEGFCTAVPINRFLMDMGIMCTLEDREAG